MSEHYREAPARCPACAVPMAAHPAGDQSVDVCPDCAGVWVDWFDGEVPAVISQHAATATGAPSGRGGSVATQPGARPCPRCFREMPAQSFYPPGPVVFRCGECGGTFVPRASFAELMAGADVPPAHGTSALARLAALLRRVFGLAP